MLTRFPVSSVVAVLAVKKAMLTSILACVSAMLQVSIADTSTTLQVSVAFLTANTATKPLTGNLVSVSCTLGSSTNAMLKFFFEIL